MAKPFFYAGDTVRLADPDHNEPTGDCVVIIDQNDSGLIWFRPVGLSSLNEGPYFVARPGVLKLIRRNKEVMNSHYCDSVTAE